MVDRYTKELGVQSKEGACVYFDEETRVCHCPYGICYELVNWSRNNVSRTGNDFCGHLTGNSVITHRFEGGMSCS